jgi:hypothetical protein
MRFQGQIFGADIIARIQASISEGLETTRSGLSRQLCEWLDWRSVNGKLCEIDARKALLVLEREGLIKLPPARIHPQQLREQGKEPPPPQIPVEVALHELGEITLVAVSKKEPELSRLWNSLLDAHHPLGSGPLCGAQQRYLIRSEQHGWLGGLAFSAAAWHLRDRDAWIGWAPITRRDNLHKVVSNSRFLLLPEVRVSHLASHVLGLAARTVADDWQHRYGYTPMLLESFVDESDYAGTCYRAANWQRVGETSGRGRQDRHNACAAGRKAIYLLPLTKQWRRGLNSCSIRPLMLPPPQQEQDDWAEVEFGRVDFVDGRLRERLLVMARDFYAQPLAPIPQACGGNSAKTKAAYRFLSNKNVDLDTLLVPHIEATAKRMEAHPVVLVAQDTTSLNYNTHKATEGLGPINTHVDGAQGLKLHDTIAFTPEGVPLGVIDAECWARDAITPDKKPGPRRTVEETEALRWITSYVQTARIQALLPETRVVSVADREADIYELFERAQQNPDGPDLLIRANRSRARRVEKDDDDKLPLLWEHVIAQPEAGTMVLHVPGKGGSKSRTADLVIRHLPVKLRPPKGNKGEALNLWAVHAIEPTPPEGIEAIEWLLLTTVPIEDFTQACERLSWYAVRWGIEIFHRTLKSGTRIEDRRLADAGNLQACLALDMVVAWRVLYLTHLGRKMPDLPCNVFFEEEEWKALWAFHHKNTTPPDEPPALGIAMRMVAQIGGFLGRKGDGDPGATVLWRGLDKLAFITDTFRIFHPALPSGP